MSGFQPKITRHTKRQKKQIEETEQASEPDSDMAEMLELSDQEFQTTRSNMLRVRLKKVDNMQEQMDNESREMEILRKDQKEILEIFLKL